MHQPNPDHPTHDLTLVAALAAGDLPEPDFAEAETLIASCSDCAGLHRDLLAIATATRDLPAPVVRTRDFQLEPAQAERVLRGSWLRRALRPFAGSSSATRPIAAAFTSLGVAGLLVAAALPALSGGTALSAPTRDSAGGSLAAQAAPTAAPAAAPAGAPSVLAPFPAATSASGYEANQYASSAAQGSAAAAKTSPERSLMRGPATFGSTAMGGDSGGGTEGGSFAGDELVTPSPPNPLVLGSVALVAVGLAMFGLRFLGRRVR